MPLGVGGRAARLAREVGGREHVARAAARGVDATGGVVTR
jgi:hypothetical protein